MSRNAGVPSERSHSDSLTSYFTTVDCMRNAVGPEIFASVALRSMTGLVADLSVTQASMDACFCKIQHTIQSVVQPLKHTFATVATGHRALVVCTTAIAAIASNIDSRRSRLDRLGRVLIALQLATCRSLKLNSSQSKVQLLLLRQSSCSCS